jgi:ketosteroid isomerase-like protein
VFAAVRYAMKSRTTGRQATMLLIHYFSFRDGKIAFYRGSEDTLLTMRTVTP